MAECENLSATPPGDLTASWRPIGKSVDREPALPAASRDRASIVCQPDARKVTMTGRCQASHGTVRGEGTCWVPRSPGNGADEPWDPRHRLRG